MLTPRDGGAGQAGPVHCLEIVDGVDVGHRYMVGPDGATIGRTLPADIVLADSEVSRAHCRLSIENGELMVADLGSTNGTFLDDVRVHEEATIVPMGSVLTVGRQSMRRIERDAPHGGADHLGASSALDAPVRAKRTRPPPDIFLSYNREDKAIAKRYADAFVAQGFDVWWDVTLRAGEAYDEVTEAALRTAKAVVVLWSKRSVVSRWVRAEATLGDRNGRLVPAMIEPCERPVMFELTQTAELGHWKGEADDPAWLDFLSDVWRFVDPEGVRSRAPAAVGQNAG
jgi:hypothetical protein